MKMLIYNAHIVSPQVDISEGAVLIEDGKIVEVYEFVDIDSFLCAKIDAGGALLVPGFIDIHTHGGGGCDVCDGDVSSIATISKYKMEEGCTSYCPTTLTLSNRQLKASLEAISEYRENELYAKVLGVHLEGPFVNEAYLGAQNPEYMRLPDIKEIDELNAICPISIVSYAPELLGGVDFTAQLSSLGIIPSAGHSSASCSCIREAEKHGLKHLTHFCNQMTPLHHREIGMVGAGLYDDELLVEVICDKVHLSPDMLRLVFKVKPEDKIAVITDSLSVTGLDDGVYDLGGLPIVLESGVARLKHNGSLAGSTLRMNEALRNVQKVTSLPLKDIIQTTSYNQAQSLGIDDLGMIAPGFVADLVLLDSDFKVLRVFVNGCEM